MSVASSFTKEKLKAALKEINITAPKESRKEVYVELYKKHILHAESRIGSEFSSDEESRTPSSEKGRVPNKKKPGSLKASPSRVKQPAIGNGTMELSLLSDDELRSKLIALGVNAGPITSSTRVVYQKKLQRLMQSGESKPRAPQPTVPPQYVAPSRQTEFSDQDDLPEPEEEPSERMYSAAALRRRPMSSVFIGRHIPGRPRPGRFDTFPEPEPEPEDEEEEEEDEDYEDEPDYTQETAPVNGPFTATKSAPKVPAKKSPQTKKWRLPIWIQILIFVIVAVLIYLLIQNLEPSQRSLIGNIGSNAGAN